MTNMLDKFSSLGKDTLIYGFGSIAGQVIGIFFVPIYTRVFTTFDYGVLDITGTITSLTTVLLISSIVGTALSYFFHKTEQNVDRKKTVTSVLLYMLVISLLPALVVLTFAEQVSYLLFETSGYEVYLHLLMLTLPFKALNILNSNLFRLRFKPWNYFTITMADILLSMVMNIVLVVVLRVGLIGVFYTDLVATGLLALVGLWMNRELIDFRAVSKDRLFELFAYGLPLVPGGAAMWVINYLDRWFLIRYHGLDEVGLYAIGNKVGAAVTLVTSAFRLAYLPYLFAMAREKNSEQFYAATLKYYLLILCILGTGISILGREIIQVLTPPTYWSAYPAVPYFAFSGIAYGLYQIVSVGLMLTKKTHVSGAAIFVAGVAHVLLLWVFVPVWGFVGAGFATLVTHIGVVLFLYMASQRTYPIPYAENTLLKTVILTAVFVISGVLIDLDSLILQILAKLVLLLCYFAGLFMFSVVTRKDIDSFVHVAVKILPVDLSRRLAKYVARFS